MTDEQIIKALEIAKGALSDGDIDMETFTALNNAIVKIYNASID